jgi:hypothetical protein
MQDIKNFNDFRDDQKHLKTFNKHINPSKVLTYFIMIDPYTEQESLEAPLQGLIQWCSDQAMQGNEILVTARPTGN